MLPRVVVCLAVLLAILTSSEGLLASKLGKRNSILVKTGASVSQFSLFVMPSDYALESDVKKWYFLEENYRPEVMISKSSTMSAILSDIWKNILVSLRVLDNEMEMVQYVSVTALPNFHVADVPEFENTVKEVMECLSTSPALFQPDIIREIKVLKKKTDDGGELCVIALQAKRSKPLAISFEELDYGDDYYPAELSKPDVWNNSLEAFPFPSVFDFISEINRPPDPSTMATLRYNFQIKDFKTDLTKMKKKKKNPQEIIDSINCKLTRLANWKEVLEKQRDKMANPFTDISDWASDVKV